MIILDTNVVSALIGDPPDAAVREWLDRQPSTSIWSTAITVLESRFGIAGTAVAVTA
jgi:predicted nucleic acid-binding protein